MILIHCDGGCGETTKEVKEFHTLGSIRQCHYCEKCAESVAAYEMEMDELHTSIVMEFELARDVARKTWMDSHKDGALPDLMPEPPVG